MSSSASPIDITTLTLYLSTIFFYTNACRLRRQRGQQHSEIKGKAVSRRPSVEESLVTPSLDANAFTDHQFSEQPAAKKRLDDDQRMLLSPISSSISLVEPIVKKIDSTTSSGDIIVIGIAGGSGSGKTTLARAIYNAIGADNIAFLCHDSYYRDLSHLPMEQREKNNFDHPDSLETTLLIEHVKALKQRQDIQVPTYDFSTHSRTKVTEHVIARPVVLVEGILIFSDPDLYKLLDIRIFVDTDDDIRFIRRVSRDTVERGRTLDGVVQQYITTVRPMHLQYVEPSKRNADLIVPVGLNSVALDLVVSKLRSHLSDNL